MENLRIHRDYTYSAVTPGIFLASDKICSKKDSMYSLKYSAGFFQSSQGGYIVVLVRVSRQDEAVPLTEPVRPSTTTVHSKHDIYSLTISPFNTFITYHLNFTTLFFC